MTPVAPLTKTARQQQIADILSRTPVRSQEELAELLAARGVRVTQATLSRDLDELGAVRLRGAAGALVYALPGTPGGPGSRPGGPGSHRGGPGSAAAGPGGHAAAGGVPGGPGRGQEAWAGEAEAGEAEAGAQAWAGEAGGRPGAAGQRAGPGGRMPVSRDDGALGPLARIAPELLVSAEASANLVVLRTPAGGAQLLASAIDHAGWSSILGTVAGDDTVLVITRDPAGGDAAAEALIAIAEHRRARQRGDSR